MPYVLFLAALLVPCAHAAEELSLGSLSDKIQVFSEVTLDLNQDGKPDQAFLVRGRQSADLYISLSRADASSTPSRALLVRKGAAFVGSRVGMLPSLEIAGTDQLILKSGNLVFGSHRFEQKLRLAIEGGELLVAGLSFEKLDPETLAPLDRCELDLLHARGKVNGSDIIPSVKAAPIATWDVDSPPGECLF